MEFFKKALIGILLVFLALNCGQKEDKKVETIIKGNATILVDETFVPIIEDQIQVFENTYDAKLTIAAMSEAEVVNSLLNQKQKIAVLARDLSDSEKKVFEQKKILPRITKIAVDAIALIRNKNTNDSLIALKEVVAFINGASNTKIKGLVFDNPNSSTVRVLTNLANAKEMRKDQVFSFKTNQEVIKFVAENEGMIGVVGVNWLAQPLPEMQSFIDKIQVLSVESLSQKGFFSPTQNDLAEAKYPLARDLYIVNCQGNSGLGMGFASFVAGDIGQRIILKSGLLPNKIPGRKFTIRKNIYKN